MPPQTGQEWDQDFTDAFNAGDADAVVARFEPDGLWVTEPGRSVRGHAAIAEGLAGILRHAPEDRRDDQGGARPG